jgi:osmoprotectant transport system permease protein
MGSIIFERLTNFNTARILSGTLPVRGITLLMDFFFQDRENADPGIPSKMSFIED